MDLIILSATNGNNLKLAETLSEKSKELGIENEVVKLEDLDLPLYTPKAEADGIAQAVTDLTVKVREAKSLMLVGPEYNGSIPPVMNNAIAWISRSGDEDWRAAFNGKFGIVGTHSGGGGAKVCQAMRQQLEHLGCIVLARQFVTNYSKPLKDESAEQILTQLKSFL